MLLKLLNTFPKDINSYGYIYKITNLINNKIYIGQTILSPHTRLIRHFLSNEPSMPVCHAIKKYGRTNFIIEVLKICLDKVELNQSERNLIKQYNSRNSLIGYNIAPGGQPELTEEGRQKISAMLKGKPKSPEHIEKVRLANLGKKRSEEQKNKIKQKKTLLNGKSILIFNLKNKTYNEFPSIREAARHNKIPKSGISRLIKNVNSTYKDFRAILTKNFTNNLLETIWIKSEKPKNSLKINLINKNTKENINFFSYSDAAKYLNVSIETIRRRLKGAKRKDKGLNNFIFERI